MQTIYDGTYWCSRCGTVKIGRQEPIAIYRPALIARCRSFREALEMPGLPGFDEDVAKSLWRQTGIEESIGK